MYDMDAQAVNPYAVAPAAGISLSEPQHHASGNSLAANAETRAVAEVKAQVLMARQFPRDPAVSVERILGECKRPTLAEKAVYSYPRAKEMVTGPSIRLAEVLARNWGNSTFGYEVLERNKDARGIGYSVIRAFAWDLETNLYISRQFTLKHWRATRSGGYALTDDRDIYEIEANMASRRVRACILQLIPGDVTQAAVAACRQTSAGGLAAAMENPSERARLVSGTIGVYERMGVTLDDLEGYLSANQADWTADHMVRLKELKSALSDNVTSLGDAFPRLKSLGGNDVISREQVETLMELAKRTGRQGDVSDALKAMGIAKFADTPTERYDEVASLIASFAPTQEQK